MAGRFARLLQSLGVEGTVFLSGGLAADDGLAAALSAALAQGAARGAAPLELARHPLSAYAGRDRRGDLGSLPPAEGRHGGSRMDGERDDLNDPHAHARRTCRVWSGWTTRSPAATARPGTKGS